MAVLLQLRACSACPQVRSLRRVAERILAKIAVLLDDAVRERERLGAPPGLRSELIAQDDDWAVEDVICTYRANDAAFEERHDRYRIALVGFGTFHCRSAGGRELLTPGSLLLGNARDCFECGHE